MAEIELVIKIPEDVYTRLFDNGIQDNEIAVDDVCEMARALRLGTPIEQEPCKDNIGRKAVLDTLDTADKFLDEDRTVERYKNMLADAYEVLPSVKPGIPVLLD